MESTGKRGKIQVSESTAALVTEAGREHWLSPRKDQVSAKGKGLLKTFFADPTRKRGSSCGSEDIAGEVTTTGSLLGFEGTTRSLQERLVEWMVDLLMDDVKKIVHVRQRSGIKSSNDSLVFFPKKGSTCMSEVKTVIEMPKFDKKAASFTIGNYSQVAISSKVVASLREYVSIIASMYHDSPFHNFGKYF